MKNAYKTEHTPLPTPNITVDCSKNPLDIRVYTDKIMRTANWILNRIPKDVPLVILMGETHDIPSNNIAPLAVLKSFHQQALKPKLAYSMEYEHTIIKDHQLTRMKDLIEILKQNKSENFKDPTEAQGLVLDYCLNNDIDIIFNDIKYIFEKDKKNKETDSVIIDQSDLWSRSLVKRYIPKKLDKKIYRYSKKYNDKKGMMLSNRSMFELAAQHIKENNTKVYIQNVGGFHVVGSNVYRYKYKHSLCAMHRAAGHAVLNCFANKEYIPHDAAATMEQSIQAISMDESQTNDPKKHREILEKINVASQGIIFGSNQP